MCREVQSAEGWRENLRSLVAPACLPDNNWWAERRWLGRERWAAVPRRVNGTRGREIGGEGREGATSLEPCLLFGAINKGAGLFFFFLECLIGGQKFIFTPIGWANGKERVF